ncbi:hypothetical protein BJV74DRAFT_822072 [Russula compacta]|nr:hypothetical protein BJV74DRAFT_822072 [Russula compacta]
MLPWMIPFPFSLQVSQKNLFTLLRSITSYIFRNFKNPIFAAYTKRTGGCALVSYSCRSYLVRAFLFDRVWVHTTVPHPQISCRPRSPDKAHCPSPLADCYYWSDRGAHGANSATARDLFYFIFSDLRAPWAELCPHDVTHGMLYTVKSTQHTHHHHHHHHHPPLGRC